MKNPPAARKRRALYAGVPVIAVILTIVACGADRPGAAADGTTPAGGGDRCATPNEGCDCLEPGLRVECGEVTNRSSDGFVQCSMGHRQCLGGTWGVCVGETDVLKPRSFMAGGGLSPRALGTGAKCGSDGGGPSNPCDPYCNAFVDDPLGLVPEGGLLVVDGGLTVGLPDAGGDGDGGASPVFQSTSDGTAGCGGASNIIGPSCTPPGLATCQQDFRCDPTSNTCAWNGGPGYYDPAAGGPDLTVGAPCGPSGSGSATAPVCNRGSAPVPAGSTITFHVTAGLPSGCSNLGTPTLVNVLSQPLVPGQCVNFSLGNSTGNKFITVNAGVPGAVTEGGGLCANNSAVFKDDGAPGCAVCGSCSTTVTGKVYDPSGPTGNNLPLAGITVLQPVGTLTTFVDGVTCDSCTSLNSTSSTETVTDATGSFTLANVTPGVNVPIVVQSGRWRRKVILPTVTACVTNTPAAGTFRMPQNRTDGAGGFADIPKMAIELGSEEALECLLLKIGISGSEIQPRTAATNANRVQLYRDNGFTTTPAAAGIATLYAAGGSLNEYAAVLFDCHNASGGGATMYSSTAADRDRFRAYADAGGRLFLDHYPGEVVLRNGPAAFAATSTWQGNAAPPAPAGGKVLLASPPHVLFRDWLSNVGASTDYGTGFVRVDEPKVMSLTPAASTEKWIRGESSSSPGNWTGNPGGDYSLSYSFDTPLGAADCGVAGGHGRVFFNGMHVSSSRILGGKPTTGKAFPAKCDLTFGLTPEEKALEYQLFQLTACQLGGATPPPPPAPPPPLPVVDYVRDYYAMCGPGERVKWGPFYWEGLFPPGTSVGFRAATASTQAALPPSPPAGTPTTAFVGTTGATVLAPTWDCTGCPTTPVSVESQLLADTGTLSKDYLRVYMKFTPTATVPPVLTSWRQIYDCVPAE